MRKLLGVVVAVGVLGLASIGFAHDPSGYGQGWRTQAETMGPQYGPRPNVSRGRMVGTTAWARGHFGRWMSGQQFGPGPQGCARFGAWATQRTRAN